MDSIKYNHFDPFLAYAIGELWKIITFGSAKKKLFSDPI